MKIKSFLITAVLATAILGFGFVASAQTTDVSALIAQLQAQIQSLMQQIQQLQSQQNGTQQWCFTFNTNLGFSQSGIADVGALHTILDKQGFFYAPDTGNIYNEGTAHAVIQLQTKYGILQTGYVGPLTRAKLNSLYGCGTKPLPTNCTSGQTLGCNVGNGAGLMTCTNGQWGACIVSSTPPTGWQTYTGQNNDYSISYSSDYTVNSSDPTCVVVQNGMGGIYINDGFNSNVPGQAMPASCGPRFGGSSTASRTTENVNVGGQQYSATGWVEKSGYISGFFTFGLTDKITVSYEVNYMAPVNGIFPSITNDQYNNAMSSLKQVLATMNSSLMPSSSLKITSPASGATLTEGQTYPIRWTGGSGNYNVYVNCTNAPIGDEGYVGSVKASDGVFQWTVGNFSEITTSANCRLNFLYPSNNLPVAYSNYFNIFASQPQSGITVIAPVGGEVLTENSKAVGSLSSVDSQNQIFEIKWTGAPDSSSDVYGDNAGNPSRIAAYLEQNGNVIGRIIPEGYGSIFWIVGEVSNTNCINCMVGNGSCPSSTSASSCYSSIRLVAPGTYNVKIVDTQTGAFGRSRPFTLVAQKSCTPNWQCTAWSACGVNAQQTRTCSDTNNCGFTVGKPALSQSCGSTPTITVTSPTGGSYTNGQNIVISYTASGLDSSKQYIALITMRHPGDNCPGPNCIGGSFSLAQPCYTGSCTNVPVTNGNNSISLSIPYTLSQSSGIYQVNFSVIDLATLGQEGATAVASTIGSGLITVSRSSTYVTPTITITSPGAGAQWVQGSTHNITWTSTNLPANEQVTIMALDYNDNASARQDISIASGVPASQGTYSWTVPTNVLGNKFDMQISGPDVAGLQVSGPAGNNATGFLSIVAPTTSMNVSQSSLASISSALQAVLQGIKQLTGQ